MAEVFAASLGFCRPSKSSLLFERSEVSFMNGLDAVAEQPPGDRWVLVRTADVDGGRVELTVEDSGKGIAESDLSRVFEPFFTTKQKGLGMGLSISRSIVQAHGGRVWAESVVGGGAIFRCMLPAAQQGAAASAK